MLELLDAGAAQPVFVPCRRGADRTGLRMARYRISHDNWTSRQALREANRDGMGWMELGKRLYVLNFHGAQLRFPILQ